jgi:hypothetical protein
VITKVVYARLYNLGDYENERLEVEVYVEDDNTQLAFAEAKAAIEEQHARLDAERAEAARRAQEEWEAKRQEQLAAIRARESANEPSF